MPEEGEYVVTPPHYPKTGGFVPGVARFEGRGFVNVMGVIPTSIDAEVAISLGHRLVEAGIGARRKDRR